MKGTFSFIGSSRPAWARDPEEGGKEGKKGRREGRKREGGKEGRYGLFKAKLLDQQKSSPTLQMRLFIAYLLVLPPENPPQATLEVLRIPVSQCLPAASPGSSRGLLAGPLS